MPWFVTTWAALARVDTLALLFSLAGLASSLRRGATRRPGRRCLLFWLAFFTKQNALLAPPRCCGTSCSRATVASRGRSSPTRCRSRSPSGSLVLATHGAAWRHLVPYTAAADVRVGAGWRRATSSSR